MMIHYLINPKKIIPNEYHKSIYDVDYAKLYAKGCRIILTDLDNTLISYCEKKPTEKLLAWKKMVEEIGFKIVLLSNSRRHRVSMFANELDVVYSHFALKPLKRGYKLALRKIGVLDKSSVVYMGDQLVTDIFGARRMNLYSILIDAVERKTEKLFTRINRHIEKLILKRAKRKYPEQFKVLDEYAGEYYGI